MTSTLFFKLFEIFINVFIVVDILCKIKIIGLKNYFRNKFNVIEFLIGVTCVLMYLGYLYTATLDTIYYDEVLESVIFIFW